MRLDSYDFSLPYDFSRADDVVILHRHDEVHMTMLRENRISVHEDATQT